MRASDSHPGMSGSANLSSSWAYASGSLEAIPDQRFRFDSASLKTRNPSGISSLMSSTACAADPFLEITAPQSLFAHMGQSLQLRFRRGQRLGDLDTDKTPPESNLKTLADVSKER